jgi:O-methyltransferase involved in polyketide biosynthesis
MMTKDPSVTYIETDLPEMLYEKIDLVRDILRKENESRPNLHFLDADALNCEQLRKAASLTEGELTIAQEGLFVYMPRRDQKRVAENVFEILHERGGMWITDVSLKSEMTQHLDEQRIGMVSAIQKEININLQDNAFADDAEVKVFFEGEGFAIEDRLNLFDIRDSLVSLGKTGASQWQLKAMLETRFIYLLRVARDYSTIAAEALQS